jgi:hypothetical protein
MPDVAGWEDKVWADDPAPREKPLATTPFGRLATWGADDAAPPGYLLVCGRGLASTGLGPSLPSLAGRSGADWFPRFPVLRWRRVFSNNQCVQFFQVAMMARDGRFLGLRLGAGAVEAASRASLVVTK